MFKNLFNPDAARQQAQQRAAERRACARVKDMVLEMIPAEFQTGLIVSVSQVLCGEPGCAPIDTVILLTWDHGLSKVRADINPGPDPASLRPPHRTPSSPDPLPQPVKIALEAKQVDYPDLQEGMPPVEVFEAWSGGDNVKIDTLRFTGRGRGGYADGLAIPRTP